MIDGSDGRRAIGVTGWRRPHLSLALFEVELGLVDGVAQRSDGRVEPRHVCLVPAWGIRRERGRTDGATDGGTYNRGRKRPERHKKHSDKRCCSEYTERGGHNRVIGVATNENAAHCFGVDWRLAVGTCEAVHLCGSIGARAVAACWLTWRVCAFSVVDVRESRAALLLVELLALLDLRVVPRRLGRELGHLQKRSQRLKRN